jgi:hypothetical protein
MWMHDMTDPSRTVIHWVFHLLGAPARITVNDKHLSRLKMAVSFLKPTGIRFKTQVRGNDLET